MNIAELVRQLVKLTDEDKIKWESRPGGYTVAKNGYSITFIRQIDNSTGGTVRIDIIFVSGDNKTKTPISFNLGNYDYNTLVEAVRRREARDKNAASAIMLRHAKQVIEGIV